MCRRNVCRISIHCYFSVCPLLRNHSYQTSWAPSSFQTSFCLAFLDSSVWIPESRKGGKEMGDGATKNGIRLLATQKPTKRPGWWERKLALFWIPATGAGGGYWGGGVCLSSGQLPATYIQPVGKSFYRPREVAICRNSTVSSSSHLEIGHQWTGQRHLDCFKYG